jgi:septum formation protein
MPRPLILASGSATRLRLLQAAGIAVTVSPARIDEEALRQSLESEATPPRDIADALADLKAAKVASRNPEALVLGCDQVMEFDARAWGKPDSPDAALAQLRMLCGKTHQLHSAIVLHDQAKPVWRHLATAKLTMRAASDSWLDDYVSRNWEEIRHSTGSYLIEAEGIRLFTAIEGDYFAILGLPLPPLLGYLTDRGFIDA